VITGTWARTSADRAQLPVVIFDGDDTLWITEPLYDGVRAEVRDIVAASGVDAALWERLELAIDVENVARFGLSAERFPTSCVEAYRAAAKQSDITPDEATADAVRTAARSVFERAAPLAPHATQVLETLHTTHRLVLLTQGDPAVQAKRVADSGLADLFDGVIVVPSKSAETLLQVLQRLDAAPSSSWMVGNSIPSDINPALECGMAAVWVDADVWDHERRELPKLGDALYAVSDLLEALALIEQPALTRE
jgi:putative hydrolase of the HAD superfamily